MPADSDPLTPPGPDRAFDLEQVDDRLQCMQALWQHYGDCYRVRAVSRDADTWVINDPDWVRRVLVSNHRNYTKGVGIERVRVLLGNGLMASEGAQWRRQRRMLQAAFHKPVIESFFPVYRRQAQQLAQHWRRAALAGEAVNVTASVSDSTLQVVLQALFSADLDVLQRTPQGNPFAMVSSDSQRDLQFAVRFRALGRQVQAIIDARRRERRFPPDLLSHCLLARDPGSGAPMNDRQLVDEVLTLIVAGHETTAASLNWVWYLLAQHPEAYRQVADEARRVDAAAISDWRTLQTLPASTQVIKEALRLYPPGWLYTRRAIGADRFGDYEVPAGADVFICAWLLHRHPGYWQAPERFMPQRFTPAQEAQRHRFAYLPFSAGPRHCIGESFAMAEMIIHLLVLARQFAPAGEAPPPAELEPEVNLRPRQPLLLRFTVLE
jgi:cytochrome P450